MYVCMNVCKLGSYGVRQLGKIRMFVRKIRMFVRKLDCLYEKRSLVKGLFGSTEKV